MIMSNLLLCSDEEVMVVVVEVNPIRPCLTTTPTSLHTDRHARRREGGEGERVDHCGTGPDLTILLLHSMH